MSWRDHGTKCLWKKPRRLRGQGTAWDYGESSFLEAGSVLSLPELQQRYLEGATWEQFCSPREEKIHPGMLSPGMIPGNPVLSSRMEAGKTLLH